MSQVVIDDRLHRQLASSPAGVQLVDAQGSAVGMALSSQEYEKLLYALARSRVSDEELDRRSAEGGTATLKDILAEVGAA